MTYRLFKYVLFIFHAEKFFIPLVKNLSTKIQIPESILIQLNV